MGLGLQSEVKLPDGWMSLGELSWLYQNAREMQNIAEIGSWKGRSTTVLCLGCPGDVYAIDEWLPTYHMFAGFHETAANVYGQFIANMSHFPNLIVKRKQSVRAAKDYPDKFFDMVFIDADHEYLSVKEDIKAWISKAKRLFCGHDYNVIDWPGVVLAVDELVGDVEVNETIWSKGMA